MQATPRKLLDLFGNPLRYVVPIFQRHYVWSAESQWVPIWEDLTEKLSIRLARGKTAPHFLGALILDTVRKKSTKEVTRFVVIDGQQRITTVQLLLAALRDFAASKASDKLATAVGRNLFNPDPELMEDSQSEQFKLWPTQFNRKIFCDVITAGSRAKVEELYPIVTRYRKRKPEPRDRLVEAYIFFYDHIGETCQLYGSKHKLEDVLLEIHGVLKDDFAVVEIILDEADDSQEIFNSLNARGKPLSQSDLLRSFIFMRAEKGKEDRDRLYNEHWSRFEDEFWDREIRRGNIWSSQLDVLTRMFLSSRLGRPVDSKKVHLEYKNWIRGANPFPTVEDELRQFSRYGTRYKTLLEPADGDPFAKFAKRLQIWDVTTVYPLILFLFEEAGLDHVELEKCFKDLESFVVRRLVCGKDNKEYNKYFLDIVATLRTNGATFANLRSQLASGAGATRDWPHDDEFEHNWKNAQLYPSMAAQVALILKLIDDQLRTNKTEQITVPSVSVEHVMPQEWADHYPLNGQLIPKDMSRDWFYSDDLARKAIREKIEGEVQTRNAKIHTIGNLTIVTQPLNGAMRNGPFLQKKIELRNSVLILNRYFDDFDRWDEAYMDKRAQALFEVGLKIWPRPTVRT